MPAKTWPPDVMRKRGQTKREEPRESQLQYVKRLELEDGNGRRPRGAQLWSLFYWELMILLLEGRGRSWGSTGRGASDFVRPS